VDKLESRIVRESQIRRRKRRGVQKGVRILKTEKEEKNKIYFIRKMGYYSERSNVRCPQNFEPKSAKLNTTKMLLAIWAKAKLESYYGETFGGLP
jgi:hypothetical protein